MTDIQHYDTPDVTDDGLALLMKQAQALDAAHKIGTALANTQMVPQAFRGKPDDAAAAILYGAELGLQPTQALQQVFVVHGQPAIYARTMVGLLKAKGYRFETVESTDESVTVRGESPRGEVEESTWTIERAKKAGYTSNKKYQSDPQAMLYAKAASEVSRKLAPDVLLGIRYSAEELELEPVKMTATRKPAPKTLQAALTSKPEQPEEPELDVSGLVEHIFSIETQDELTDLMGGLDARFAEHEAVKKAANTRWSEIA